MVFYVIKLYGYSYRYRDKNEDINVTIVGK